MRNQEQEMPYRLEMWDEHDTRVEELSARRLRIDGMGG
jgi:hypothetical protein